MRDNKINNIIQKINNNDKCNQWIEFKADKDKDRSKS